MSIFLSVCLFDCIASWRSNREACNCMQGMRPQEMGTNPLSGSITFLSVHPSGCLWAFCKFCICTNFQCGGPASRCIYSRNRVQSSLYVHLSLCPSICISTFYSCHPHRFLVTIFAAHNCAQRIRPQAMGAHPLSCIIVCSSVHTSSCPYDFCDFCICIDLQCVVPALR